MFALSGKEVGPGNNIRVLFEQRATLPLGHASPDAELDAVVQGIGAAFGDHGAMAADDRGFALRGAAHEQFVRIGLATPGLRNPRNTRFGLRTVQNGLGRRIHGGLASRGLD